MLPPRLLITGPPTFSWQNLCTPAGPGSAVGVRPVQRPPGSPRTQPPARAATAERCWSRGVGQIDPQQARPERDDYSTEADTRERRVRDWTADAASAHPILQAEKLNEERRLVLISSTGGV